LRMPTRGHASASLMTLYVPLRPLGARISVAVTFLLSSVVLHGRRDKNSSARRAPSHSRRSGGVAVVRLMHLVLVPCSLPDCLPDCYPALASFTTISPCPSRHADSHSSRAPHPRRECAHARAQPLLPLRNSPPHRPTSAPGRLAFVAAGGTGGTGRDLS